MHLLFALPAGISIVKLMGRQSGFIAMNASMASGGGLEHHLGAPFTAAVAAFRRHRGSAGLWCH